MRFSNTIPQPHGTFSEFELKPDRIHKTRSSWEKLLIGCNRHLWRLEHLLIRLGKLGGNPPVPQPTGFCAAHLTHSLKVTWNTHTQKKWYALWCAYDRTFQTIIRIWMSGHVIQWLCGFKMSLKCQKSNWNFLKMINLQVVPVNMSKTIEQCGNFRCQQNITNVCKSKQIHLQHKVYVAYVWTCV